MTESNPPSLPIALLLVDWQSVFVEAMPTGAQAARRAEFAAHAAQLLGIAVAITEQAPDKLGATMPAIREAAPEAPVFPKTAFSALAAEGLIPWLRDRNAQHLLLTGLESTVCIYQSAVQAMAEQFDVTLLSDAITQRRDDDRLDAFATLRNAGAHILPAETVFYSLFGDASHPRFREFTKLVKAYGA